jgi:hypothetical protein
MKLYIPLQNIHLKEMTILHTRAYMKIFIGALWIITSRWRNLKCLSKDEQMSKLNTTIHFGKMGAQKGAKY